MELGAGVNLGSPGERPAPEVIAKSKTPGFMTVAVSANHRRAGKAFRMDLDGNYHAVQKVEFGRFFIYNSAAFGNLSEMLEVLKRIARDNYTFVLRGVPIEWNEKPQLRRIKSQTNPDTGEFEPATLRDEALSWIALDFDKLPAIPGRDVRGIQAEEIARYALSTCPNEFGDASCVLQLTSSHALEPGKIRCRLWMLLSRPVLGNELKAWFQGCPVDKSIFGAHQPIFTANPEFIKCANPVPDRWFLIRGKRGEVVQVPSEFPSPPEKAAKAKTTGTKVPGCGGSGSTWPPLDKPKGWLRLLYLCGVGPGRYGFFEPIKSAVGSYIAVYGPDADPEPLMREIEFILDLRGWEVRSAEYLDGRLDDARVWFEKCCALERAKRSELIECPCPNVPRASLAEAVAALRQALS